MVFFFCILGFSLLYSSSSPFFFVLSPVLPPFPLFSPLLAHSDPNGFDNDYFRLLLSEKWVVKKNFQPTQYEDATTGELMMLPTDMALIWDPKFRVWVEKYAKDQDLWHKDFAKAFGKLMDLGVPRK